MASASEIDCGPCKYRTIVVPGIVWCPICEEGLCSECLDHHKAVKALRNHDTIPIDCYQDIQKEVRDLDLQCTLHNEKYELYCPVHEVHCCFQCANSEHNKCIGVTLLHKFIENIKSSASLVSLEQALQERITHFEKIKLNRKGNINRIEKQASDMEEGIGNIRSDLENRIAATESQLKTDLKIQKQEQISSIHDVINQLESHSNVCSEMTSTLSKLKKNGTNFQLYTIIKKYEANLKKEDKALGFTEKEKGMQEIDFYFSKSSEIDQFLTKDSSFGTIEINRLPPKWEKSIRKDHTAQMLSTESVNSAVISKQLQKVPDHENAIIHTVKKLGSVASMKFLKYIDTECLTTECDNIEDANLSNAVILPSGDIIITNSGDQGGISVFDKNGCLISEITNLGKAHCACLVDSRHLAFSFPTNENVKLVSVDHMTLLKTFRLGFMCVGLASAKGNIVVCTRPSSIFIIDIDGNILKEMDLHLNGITHVQFYQKYMLITQAKSNIIWCFDQYGNEEKQFDLGNMDFRNLCVDKYGNIFFSEVNSNKIYVLSFTSGKTRELLNEIDGLEQPKAIAYNDKSNSLVIAGKNGVFSAIYDIVYE
ncbi:uncharacterized protein LOC134681873 [Mytilus trossulus]|uniref:uncharacterized protein LOC134681873 n=1 Tax=Mytilus trossulus TaxID=6551 RepID=UPI00300725A2